MWLWKHLLKISLLNSNNDSSNRWNIRISRCVLFQTRPCSRSHPSAGRLPPSTRIPFSNQSSGPIILDARRPTRNSSSYDRASRDSVSSICSIGTPVGGQKFGRTPPVRRHPAELTKLKNALVCQAISSRPFSSSGAYICLAIRKTAEEVSWPFYRRAAWDRGVRRAFSRSAACSEPLDGITMETDVPIPLFPEMFPHETTPLLHPCPASLIPNFRSFHLDRRSSDWARSHLLPPGHPPRKGRRIFVWRHGRNGRFSGRRLSRIRSTLGHGA